jgi:hypothetical protein
LICDQIEGLSDVAVCTCPDYGSLDSFPAMAEAVGARGHMSMMEHPAEVTVAMRARLSLNRPDSGF